MYALSERHIQWLQFDPLLDIFRAGVPRILIFLSRNSDSVDLCCLNEVFISQDSLHGICRVRAQIGAIRCAFQNILVYSSIRVRFGAAESEAVQILIPMIEAFIRSNPFIDH